MSHALRNHRETDEKPFTGQKLLKFDFKTLPGPKCIVCYDHSVYDKRRRDILHVITRDPRGQCTVVGIKKVQNQCARTSM